METAKLFKNGRSQAVRLPRKYSFSGNEVYVKKVDGVVVLIPKDEDPWKPLIDSLEKYSDDFSISIEIKASPKRGIKLSEVPSRYKHVYLHN